MSEFDLGPDDEPPQKKENSERKHTDPDVESGIA